jgi:hypothetical protein
MTFLNGYVSSAARLSSRKTKEELKMENTLVGLHDMEIHASQAEVVTWQGCEALRLENGLALAPKGGVKDASIEVMIGTDGPAYPGVAFRVADVQNYELAYAVPHVSGEWDALQYDPVFHGSNTWQLYHGPGYQREAQVPTGRWFRLKVDCCGTRTAVSVDGQPSLVVDQLAHSISMGQFGLWTFRPAYFCDLQVSLCERLELPSVEVPSIAEGIVETWFLEDFGVVACEPNGVINLNRFLPTSIEKARLVRNFEISEEVEIRFEFGYSDVLSLELDGEVVYRGENTFRSESVWKVMATGRHRLAAELEVSEGFGWGLVLSARGEGLTWLPVEPD